MLVVELIHVASCGQVPGAVVPFWVPPPRILTFSHAGLVWHPVDLATPDRAAARGQLSTLPVAYLVKRCPRAAVW
jgi:hypothetical protein